ncbi:MAG: nucleoside-diphosphate kinase [Candidatus Krumholzibacteria bacterium]|nr:nucleoside-diphosphate kinase [Candidatus Krumholzibacteria bacterium]
MEKTFIMIKPEALKAGKQGEIIDLLLKNRFEITKMKQFSFDGARARRFYSMHEGKPFFEDLVAYITSGEVVGLELGREGAIKSLRDLTGATDPAGAAIGTIRFMYGTDLQRNAVHASDSPESAEKELAIVFGED